MGRLLHLWLLLNLSSGYSPEVQNNSAPSLWISASKPVPDPGTVCILTIVHDQYVSRLENRLARFTAQKTISEEI